MLTLTRKIGQKILIGNGIEIVVREIRGRQVRLGITAPLGLPVYREELYQQIADENARATSEISLDRLEGLPEPSVRRGSGSSTPPSTG
ncbi:MAG: carbon storage regulator [Deltaproteobacteria bacterium]|nr:carbon storage regulator [Deltaproteobacteria bacterium]MBK8237945.1 carbon storage regulator [Deltaproteobacteria bacterium]MBK8718713.1 carbon storage regulator [Deltaproteobacteria bacterium]MBP7290970.1 carbon storage regulator [Nannocystaceae bacterium]